MRVQPQVRLPVPAARQPAGHPRPRGRDGPGGGTLTSAKRGTAVRRATSRALYLPPWRIDLMLRDGVPRPLSGAAIARAAARALTATGASGPASIGVILSDDAELAELNREHMGHHGPTDVLSFPLLPPSAFPPHPGQDRTEPQGTAAFALPPGRRLHLGDIVVSVERAVAQASQGRGGQTGSERWSTADELLLLVTHGALHVCGWDHALSSERTAMRELERRLLGRT